MYDFENLCRLCMGSRNILHAAFQENFHDKVRECVDISIHEDDILPSQICALCSLKVKDFYEFKQNCFKVQNLLLKYFEEKEVDVNKQYVKDEQVDIEEEQITTDNEATCAAVTVEETDDLGLDTVEADLEYTIEALENEELDEIEQLEHLQENADEKEKEGSSEIVADPEPAVLPVIKSSRQRKVRSETFDAQTSESRNRSKKERNEKEIYKSLLLSCDVCGKMIERNRMEGHRNQHAGLRPYLCTEDGIQCDAAFHCKIALRLHVKNKHSNENHICEICNKNYPSKKALYHHKKETHAAKQFACQICGLAFVSNARLNRHKITHSGERNYPCPMCTKAFYRSNNLKIHLRTHTKERPFQCEFCMKDFGYNRLLKDHLEKYHPYPVNINSQQNERNFGIDEN